MAPDKFTLRPVTPDDAPSLLDVLKSGFQDNALSTRAFPASDPASDEGHLDFITKNLAEILAATDSSGAILGFARWCRRPAPTEPPPTPLTNDMYPPTGDPDLARRFFQANIDRAAEIVAGRPLWFLSMAVVRREEQGRGVGSVLMRHGTELADEDGWIAYLNASPEGVPVYERYGFRTVMTSEFEHGIRTYHMVREPGGK